MASLLVVTHLSRRCSFGCHLSSNARTVWLAAVKGSPFSHYEVVCWVLLLLAVSLLVLKAAKPAVYIAPRALHVQKVSITEMSTAGTDDKPSGRYAVYASCVAIILSALWQLPGSRETPAADQLADQLQHAFLEALADNSSMWSAEDVPPPSFSRTAAKEPADPNSDQRIPFRQTTSLPDHGWHRYGMNMTVSDLLPLRRTLPDTRAAECRHWRYPARLPSVSVVIVFHNEGLSTLLRTVQTVLDRSPAALLHEILLVDDFSHFADLETPLRSAVSHLPSVRLLRTSRREGLIRARVQGALAATGQVLLFLDAHCEVNRHWLPPLLATVARNRRTVAVPLLDAIDSHSFQYRPLYGATGGHQGAPLLPRGIFDWALRYKERTLTEAELRNRSAASAPYSTATHSGGIFAISRWWFFYLGAYDPQLLGWGAENMELSFKAWMCGGDIQMVPCSRVGHVYRDRTPYSFGDLTARRNAPIISTNFLRVAHVWMDGYLEHFLTEEPASRHLSPGDVTSRQLLRRQLACRSFDWYLATVAAELPAVFPSPPANLHWGQIIHEASGLCAVSDGEVEPGVHTLALRHCQQSGPAQIFRLSEAGRLLLGEVCAGFMPSVDSVVVSRCPGTARFMSWNYHQANGTLEHALLGRCLTATLAPSGGLPPTDQVAPPSDHQAAAPAGRLSLAACDPGRRSQVFSWRQPAAGVSLTSRLLETARHWWHRG